jgi:hypothetical protein
MTVLWFILGIALIFGIARYNESNKLFWLLLFSFVMGFAGTKMIIDSHHGDEQSNGDLTQVYSTHVSTATLNAATYYITSDVLKANNVVTAQHHVSQGLTPALSETNITLSEVFERTRDQPLLTLIKPPELCLQKDFLTLHDSG